MKKKIAINLTKNRLSYQFIAAEIKENCGKKMDDLELIFCPDTETLQAHVGDCEVVACYDFFKPIFDRAEKLKWVHFGSAGIEHTLYPELVNSEVLITNSRGIHGSPMSEFVMAAILNYAKRFDRCRELRMVREWQKWEVAKTILTLSGKTIGLLGLGAVGKAVAEKAKSFGMRVLAFKLNPESVEKKTIDQYFYGSDLKKLITQSDYVVILLPLTSKTKKMLSKEQLSWMKPDAYLINVSRGKIIDQSALIDVLRERKIAGAFLDVFEEEPLPEDSPLYELDNVFITPHIAGNFPEYVQKVGEIFADNLNRYLSQQPMFNIYDRGLEY